MTCYAKISLLAALAFVLTACGGDGEDLAQSLNIAAPQARFVNAAPASPELTLYRKGQAQSAAGTQGYQGASKYYDTVDVTSDWAVRDAGTGAELGTTTMRVENSTRYTLVVLPGSGPQFNLLQISDPYDKALGSDEARVRLVNADAGTGPVDVYIAAAGADISGLTPTMASVASQASSPASGSNSISVAAGTYQVQLAAAGSKTIFFSGSLEIGKDDDVLLVTLPEGDGGGTKILDIPAGSAQSNAEILNSLQ